MACSVKIDKLSCQSSGNCVELAPEAFRFDADALGDPTPDAARLAPEELLAVARRCPALAITVFDEAGNELDL